MADKGLDVTIDDAEVKRMVEKLLVKMQQPRPLLDEIGRYIRALTTKLFADGARRPDSSAVRGVQWPKLAESTIKAKKAAIKSGRAIPGALRPLVFKGRLRDDLASPRSLQVKKKGLIYGTDRKSKGGFPYPGKHNVGDKVPQRKWLFLNRQELRQILEATKQFIEGRLIKLKA